MSWLFIVFESLFKCNANCIRFRVRLWSHSDSNAHSPRSTRLKNHFSINYAAYCLLCGHPERNLNVESIQSRKKKTSKLFVGCRIETAGCWLWWNGEKIASSISRRLALLPRIDIYHKKPSPPPSPPPPPVTNYRSLPMRASLDISNLYLFLRRTHHISILRDFHSIFYKLRLNRMRCSVETLWLQKYQKWSPTTDLDN